MLIQIRDALYHGASHVSQRLCKCGPELCYNLISSVIRNLVLIRLAFYITS